MRRERTFTVRPIGDGVHRCARCHAPLRTGQQAIAVVVDDGAWMEHAVECPPQCEPVGQNRVIQRRRKP